MMNKRAACVLVANDKGQFLSVSRKDNVNLVGLPGGKCDIDESTVHAARRELKEETGLDIAHCTSLFECYEGDTWTVTFVAEVTGEISTAEAGRVMWVTREALCGESSPFAEYNRRVFETYDWWCESLPWV